MALAKGLDRHQDGSQFRPSSLWHSVLSRIYPSTFVSLFKGPVALFYYDQRVVHKRATGDGLFLVFMHASVQAKVICRFRKAKPCIQGDRHPQFAWDRGVFWNAGCRDNTRIVPGKRRGSVTTDPGTFPLAGSPRLRICSQAPMPPRA